MDLRVAVAGELVHHDLSRSIQGLHIVQQQTQQLQLPEALVGKAEGVAQGETGVQCAGWFDFLADAPGEGHRDGGDPRCLDGSLNQSHGLVAEPSGGGQDGDINTIVLEHLRDPGGGGVDQGVDMGR